jgi:YggT family protein
MTSLLHFVAQLIQLYIYVIVAQAILSWLMAFNVVNTRNKFVYAVGNALYVLTEPLLRRIRRVVPATSGIDFSPLVAILGLWFVQQVVILDWLLSAVRHA